MTEQNRLVYGCYDSVDDVAAVIEELRSKQFTNSDMTLVTREDKVLAYSEKLGIPIQTEKDVFTLCKNALVFVYRIQLFVSCILSL